MHTWTLTTYSLNGPDVTHPPPEPGARCIKQGPDIPSQGKQDEFRPGTYSPSPNMLEALPSKKDRFWGRWRSAPSCSMETCLCSYTRLAASAQKPM